MRSWTSESGRSLRLNAIADRNVHLAAEHAGIGHEFPCCRQPGHNASNRRQQKIANSPVTRVNQFGVPPYIGIHDRVQKIKAIRVAMIEWHFAAAQPCGDLAHEEPAVVSHKEIRWPRWRRRLQRRWDLQACHGLIERWMAFCRCAKCGLVARRSIGWREVCMVDIVEIPSGIDTAPCLLVETLTWWPAPGPRWWSHF